jgi:hypothetical protein
MKYGVKHRNARSVGGKVWKMNMPTTFIRSWGSWDLSSLDTCFGRHNSNVDWRSSILMVNVTEDVRQVWLAPIVAQINAYH